MKCMCAQTRPRFILSSERVFWGMEFEPMLTPKEKSPLPENVPRGGSNPRRCGQRAQTLPTGRSCLHREQPALLVLKDWGWKVLDCLSVCLCLLPCLSVFYVCLSVCLTASVFLFVCLSHSVCLSVLWVCLCLPLCLSLSVSLSLCVSVCLSLSLCLFVVVFFSAVSTPRQQLNRYNLSVR